MKSVKVVTSKPINIVQLRIEAGTINLWDFVRPDGKVEVFGQIEDEKDFDALLASHSAKEVVTAPTVQEQLDSLTNTLLSKGTINAADVAETKRPRKRT